MLSSAPASLKHGNNLLGAEQAAQLIWFVSFVEYAALGWWVLQNKRVARHRGQEKAIKDMAARQILLPFFETIILLSVVVVVMRGGAVVYLVRKYGDITSLDEWAEIPLEESFLFGLLLVALNVFQIAFVPMYLLNNTIGSQVYYYALYWSAGLAFLGFASCMVPSSVRTLVQMINPGHDKYTHHATKTGHHHAIASHAHSSSSSAAHASPHGGGWNETMILDTMDYLDHHSVYAPIGFLGLTGFGCIMILVYIIQHRNPRWGCQLQCYVTAAAGYYLAIVYGLLHLHPSFAEPSPVPVAKRTFPTSIEAHAQRASDNGRETLAWADVMMTLAFPVLLWLTLKREAQWWRKFALQVMGMGRVMQGMENIPVQTCHQMLRGHLSMIDFTQLDFLGRGGSGASGAVYRCRYQGKLVAAKSFVEKAISIPDLLRVGKEAFVCHRIRHENVVEFLGMCISPPDLYLVFEWCTHKTLLNILLDLQNTKLHWRTRVRFAVEVARGLNALHEHGVVHRDVKSENVLVTLNKNNRLSCKLCDFGSSRLIQTLNKSAPILSDEKTGGGRDNPSDDARIWGKTRGHMDTKSRHLNGHDAHHVMNIEDGLLKSPNPRLGANSHSANATPRDQKNHRRNTSVFDPNLPIHQTTNWEEENFLTGLVGTPAYMAPELLANIHCGANAITALARRVQYGFKVDMFSFGYVMWELLTRRQVYSNQKFSFKQIHTQVLEGVRPSLPVEMSSNSHYHEFTVLLKECWASNPGKRPRSRAVVKRLSSTYHKIRQKLKTETPAIRAVDMPADTVDYQPLARSST
uniref:Protein kinase domain-containing protein n=1 Tax=Lotharella globosa TaxID=91324 RepID=A0A7S4DLZ1_9EUKA|mmetsp:Transcript_13042/g.26586  ORF Transcript_13042/g.26586 Transcript_13042/m.26586 type:complete len:804 (+) Transcript_13042:168-2579(+)